MLSERWQLVCSGVSTLETPFRFPVQDLAKTDSVCLNLVLPRGSFAQLYLRISSSQGPLIWHQGHRKTEDLI